MKASGGGGEGAYLSGGEGGDDAKAGSVSVTYKGVSSPSCAPLIPEEWGTRTWMHEICQGPVPRH